MTNYSINLLSSSILNCKHTILCMIDFSYSVILLSKTEVICGICFLSEGSLPVVQVFCPSIIIDRSFVQRSKLHPRTQGEEPDFRHYAVPMPASFSDSTLPQSTAVLVSGTLSTDAVITAVSVNTRSLSLRSRKALQARFTWDCFPVWSLRYWPLVKRVLYTS